MHPLSTVPLPQLRRPSGAGGRGRPFGVHPDPWPTVEVQGVVVAVHAALICQHHRPHLTVVIPAGGGRASSGRRHRGEERDGCGSAGVQGSRWASVQQCRQGGRQPRGAPPNTHHLCSSVCTMGAAVWPKADIMKKMKLLWDTTARWRSGRDSSHCSSASRRAGGRAAAWVGISGRRQRQVIRRRKLATGGPFVQFHHGTARP